MNWLAVLSLPFAVVRGWHLATATSKHASVNQLVRAGLRPPEEVVEACSEDAACFLLSSNEGCVTPCTLIPLDPRPCAQLPAERPCICVQKVCLHVQPRGARLVHGYGDHVYGGGEA